MQEAAIDYLKAIRLAVNGWIEQAQNAIIERLSFPTLRKQNLLNTYNKLKIK